MTNKEENVTRRQFFGSAGKGLVGGVGAAAVAATSAGATESICDPKGDYRETTHVKTYYDLARF